MNDAGLNENATCLSEMKPGLDKTNKGSLNETNVAGLNEMNVAGLNEMNGMNEICEITEIDETRLA